MLVQTLSAEASNQDVQFLGSPAATGVGVTMGVGVVELDAV